VTKFTVLLIDDKLLTIKETEQQFS